MSAPAAETASGGRGAAVPPIVPRLDHVVVNVHDGLDEAAARYRRLGFALMPRGHHTLGSSNHLAILGETYLELFGYEPGGNARTPDLWTDPRGLTGLVFKGEDASQIHRAMTAAGLQAGEPLSFSRPVETADGMKPARFSVVAIPPGHIRNGRSFFCCHHTPELVWMPQWQSHPNGARNITGFYIASADPGRAARIYQAMFDADAVKATSDGWRFAAGAATVFIMSQEAADARFGDTIMPRPEGEDRMVALRIATRSLGAARSALEAGGTAPLSRGEGLLVPHGAASGVALEFAGPEA